MSENNGYTNIDEVDEIPDQDAGNFESAGESSLTDKDAIQDRLSFWSWATGAEYDSIQDAAIIKDGFFKRILKTITQKPKQIIMKWLKNRLKEKTTWRGIIAVLVAAGLGLSPDQKEAIIGAGVALIGVFETFFKEPESEDA